MRKNELIGMVLLCILVLPGLVAAEKKGPWEVKLPFKNAAIEYTHTGMAQGTETLYVRDHGQETARYLKTTTKMMGMTNVEETIEIQEPDWVYTFDMVQKTGVKMANPQKYFMEEYEKLSPADKRKVDENSKAMGKSFAGGMGGEVEENVSKLLGYSCDRVEVMGVKVYSIHGTGLPLKTESNMMGMSMTVEATAVNKGAAKKKYFKFPEGIEPVFDSQSDAMARQIAKQTIEMLKDPEAAKAQQGSPMMRPSSSGQQNSGATGNQPSNEEMEQAMKMFKEMFGKEKQ